MIERAFSREVKIRKRPWKVFIFGSVCFAIILGVLIGWVILKFREGHLQVTVKRERDEKRVQLPDAQLIDGLLRQNESLQKEFKDQLDEDLWRFFVREFNLENLKPEKLRRARASFMLLKPEDKSYVALDLTRLLQGVDLSGRKAEDMPNAFILFHPELFGLEKFSQEDLWRYFVREANIGNLKPEKLRRAKASFISLQPDDKSYALDMVVSLREMQRYGGKVEEMPDRERTFILSHLELFDLNDR